MALRPQVVRAHVAPLRVWGMTSLIDSKATKNLSGVKSGFKTRSMHNLVPCQKVLLQTKQYKNTELRETFSRAHLTHGQKALTLGSCVALSRPSQVEAALRQDSKVWVLSGPTALATSLWVCCLRKHALPFWWRNAGNTAGLLLSLIISMVSYRSLLLAYQGDLCPPPCMYFAAGA